MNIDYVADKVWEQFDKVVDEKKPLHEIRKFMNDLYEQVLETYADIYAPEIYSEIFAGIDVELVAMWEQDSEVE